MSSILACCKTQLYNLPHSFSVFFVILELHLVTFGLLQGQGFFSL